MSDNANWYTDSNREWYAAAPASAAAAAKKKKKKLPWGWILAAVVLVALLVVSSLLFSGRGAAPSAERDSSPFGNYIVPKSDDDGTLPMDPKEFFDKYYTTTDTGKTTINIPTVKIPGGTFTAAIAEKGDEQSLQELYQSCSESIVAISGYMDGKTGYNWGTGIVLSENGLILTNTHVIADCDSATVTLSNDEVYDAKLVGADTISDIAVLKIEAKGLKAAVFGDSSTLAVGDEVAAIGNPLGETFRFTLTNGIISGIERGVSYKGHSMNLLQTNTAINEGNSGGPLFNMYGQVIGVTNMKMMSSYSSIEGIGFAIPSTTVVEIVNDLVRDGEVAGRPSVGITIGAIPEAAQEEYGMPEGLYVSAVSEGSDAASKGVQVGDVITAVNGQHVTTTADVAAIKEELHVGDSMTFTIWRNGESFDLDIELVDTNDIYG